MPKCDTKDTDKNLLEDDGIRSGWCRRCYREFLQSDDEHPNGIRCQFCKVIHRKDAMFQKIEGWLCRDCAIEYDTKLLKQMVLADAH